MSILPRQTTQSSAFFSKIYLDVVTTAVKKHGGVVDKFVGNAVMALWGVPDQGIEDCAAAARAAVDYTVIGPTINVASRIESLSKTYQCDIVLSRDLYDRRMAMNLMRTIQI